MGNDSYLALVFLSIFSGSGSISWCCIKIEPSVVQPVLSQSRSSQIFSTWLSGAMSMTAGPDDIY